MKKLFFLVSILLQIALPVLSRGTSPSPFVWIEPTGEGRMVYVYFRYDIDLDEQPMSAVVNLVADSHYHLHVNGRFVNYGPVRFYSHHPVYDQIDLAPYLNIGKNVIAVKVLSHGMNTYQVPKSIAGFSAWGSIQMGKKVIDLSTPGNWKAISLEAYDPTSPKLSFAKAPFEVFDARDDIEGWNLPGTDTKGWITPVVIGNQDHWGKPSPREIPLLTNNEVLARSLVGAYSLRDDETIYSFRTNTPDLTRSEFGESHRLFAYTYIYSPKKQEIPAGLWWGEFYLNGVGPLSNLGEKEGIPNRADVMLKLKKGWNYFFVKYDVVWGHWDFHMALPKTASLTLSPSRELNDSVFIRTAGPFTGEDHEKVMQVGLPITNPSEPNIFAIEWKDRLLYSTAGNPAWEMAWKQFDRDLEIDWTRTRDIVIDKPAGSALVFDMGQKQLGRLFVEYEAPEGTIIDIGFSEDMLENRAYVLKRAGIYTAARCIAKGGIDRFETFKPYGVRYLQLNVTGNSGMPVNIKKVGVMSQVYPFEKKGSFECSDPLMNDIWEMGWRTLQVCAEDTYTDTPFRERGLYAGDALPQLAITLATSGDARLIKRSLEVFQDMYANLFVPGAPEPEDALGLLNDFPLITLQILAWYADWTGDIEFLQRLYPNYQFLMEQVLATRAEDGVYHHGRPFIEWTRMEKSGQLTTMHALIAQSFYTLSRLATRLGNDQEAVQYFKLANETKLVMQERFWDPEKGAFRDGFKDGEPLSSWYPISSAYPSLWGLTTNSQEESLARFFELSLEDIGDRERAGMATPYGGFYVLGALYREGMVRVAEDYIRKYWGHMVLKTNDTAWENFGDGGGSKGQGTLSHAWSGSPTYYLSSRVLGVDLGYPHVYNPGTIVIAPQAESIDWARGVTPHPWGTIEVDWRVSGNRLFLNAQVPQGVKWEVKPKGRLAKLELWVNGEVYRK